MRNLIFSFALACLMAAPAAAQGSSSPQGTPSFFGVSGLLFAPSAYTIGDRSAAVFGFGQERFNSFGALFSPIDRLEIGATFLDNQCGCFDDEWLLNAKLQLLKENRALPALSVGVVDALDNLDLDQSWFIVASKDLSPWLRLAGSDLGVKAHVGYGGGLFDDEVFAGLELDLWNPTRVLPVGRVRTSLIAEYVNNNVNLGLRAGYRGFSATFGVFDFEHIGGGLSYTHTFR